MKKDKFIFCGLAFRLIPLITATTYCLQAATFTVTTTNISGPGSLPVAVAQANATPGDNRIQISVTNAINLGLTLPTVTKNVAISGIASVPSIISGGGTLPLFTFATGTTNSLSNLVLANGYTTNSGAAINNAGTLSVSSCIITNHSATNGSGGAIINSGNMTIISSLIAGNQAGTYAFDQSIYNFGVIEYGSGGAVFNSGLMSISSSVICNNQAPNGGAIFNGGTLALDTVTFSNNLATAGFGGGICNTGTLSVLKSTFFTNSTVGGFGQNSYGGVGAGGGGGGFGGALFSASGNINLTNCTLTFNLAVGGIGGYYTNTGSGPNGGNGGGITGGRYGGYAQSGGNGGFGGGGGGANGAGGNGGFGGGGGGGGGGSMFGGMGNGGGGQGSPYNGVVNSTGNGGGGAGLGGALFIQAGICSVVNCTIVNNNSKGGFATWPGVAGSGIAGGIYNYSGTVFLLNTIVAGNVGPGSSPDLLGNFISSGYNLIGNNQGATNLSIFDFQNVSANLGTLKNNGGSTLTCVPLPGSYAIGYGTSTGAPNTDQRGVPRPQGGAFDIGAVEVVTGSPIFIGVAMSAGSGFYLNTIFDETNSYQVQASTTLTNWSVLTNYASGGAQSYVDTSATNLNHRFYRTATP